jgi:hypothetical protein
MKSRHAVSLKNGPGLYQGIGFSRAVTGTENPGLQPLHTSGLLRDADPKETLHLDAHFIAQRTSGDKSVQGLKPESSHNSYGTAEADALIQPSLFLKHALFETCAGNRNARAGVGGLESMIRFKSGNSVIMLCLLAACWAVTASGQTVPAGAAPVPTQGQSVSTKLIGTAPDQPPTVSLSPAVVMARGSFGQGLTQTLTLSNQTDADFTFEMVAQDVVIKDGTRVFVPAGETEHSIAASAVFSQKTIVIKAFTTGSVDVRLTIPAETKIRAVVAMFRGTNILPTSAKALGMTASLGALLTFNLTNNVQLEPDPAVVKPPGETSNLVVSQWITNTGTEPVVPEGMAAVLNSSGGLIGKSPFAPQRLLPGERLEFVAEYPEQLPAGAYRVLCSFQFEGKTLTKDASFKLP